MVIFFGILLETWINYILYEHKDLRFSCLGVLNHVIIGNDFFKKIIDISIKENLSLINLEISNYGNIFRKCWSKFAQIMIPAIRLGPQYGSKCYIEIFREKYSSQVAFEVDSSLFKLRLGHIELGLCRFFTLGYTKKIFDKNLLLEIKSSRKLKLVWKLVLCILKFVKSWFPGEAWAQWWGW